MDAPPKKAIFSYSMNPFASEVATVSKKLILINPNDSILQSSQLNWEDKQEYGPFLYKDSSTYYG